jgi:hypothetical protein
MMLKERCSNMTQANRYIGNIINSINNDEIVENIMINELVKYHPTKSIDFNKVEWFKIKLRSPYNKPSLFYKYKNSINDDDISWKLCIRNLYGNYNRDEEHEKDVKTAFRNESHIGTKTNYFVNNTTIPNSPSMGRVGLGQLAMPALVEHADEEDTEELGSAMGAGDKPSRGKRRVGVCRNCNKITENITTDHYNLSYKEIFNDFLYVNNINLRNIDIFENEENEIRIKDEELASKWLNHHDNKAQYRLLCCSCNSHFGSYGYS